MLIWRGWGIVVVGIAFVALLVGLFIGSALNLGVTGRNVAGALSLIPAGILIWYLGKRMNRNMDRQLIDPQTGQPVVIRNDHSLFFIRVEWWGPIIVVAGVLWAVYLLTRTPTVS